MPRPFSDFTGQFFWGFKKMDNVNYNFEIIELLYSAKRANANSTRFNKPIIIILVAMIECMFYDFANRINTFSSDPFPNINFSVVNFFRGTRDTDDLRYLIPKFKSQNILRASAGDMIYDDIEHLRLVRNRLHIQNKYNVLDNDEYNVFTEAELRRAQRCFERVCDTLCNVYPRWNKTPIPMSEFPRPW